MLTLEQINNYGLKRTHRIVIENNKLMFNAYENNRDLVDASPSVYVWTSWLEKECDRRVLYVGKAGRGVERRFKQHMGGFVNSATGRRNAELLRKEIDSGRTVDVFVRVSHVNVILGEKVSLFSAEEEALCKALSPEWNRAVFPIQHTELEELFSDINSTEEAVLPEICIEFSRFSSNSSENMDDYVSYLNSLHPGGRSIFRRLLTFVHANLLDEYNLAKIVGGYTGQPQGCNNVPMLVFGEIGNVNVLPNRWVARITLTERPRLVLPREWLREDATNMVDIGDNSFSPRDNNYFLENPGYFLASDRRRRQQI